eukprot:8422674-Pyramimonas_sp.AAC.1
MSKELARCGRRVSSALDLLAGVCLSSREGQSQMWGVLGRDEPLLVIMSHECKAFSQARAPSWDRMSPEDLAT